MKTILLTIDTEFYISKEEILGIDGKYGIDEILQILEEFDIKATFFIDYFSIKKWGEDIFYVIHEKIRAGDHEIQLHLHPFIAGGKSYLWEYDDTQQAAYISESISYYKKFNGTDPVFFRAGGYAANEQTIAILKEKGFFADLSFQYKQKRCRIPASAFPYINLAGDLNGLLEIPTTVYKYYYPFTRYNAVNLEWCSLAELKSILKKIQKSPLEQIVVMMHSFGLQNRKDRKTVKKSSYRRNKFKRFLTYAKKNNFKFSTVADFYQSLSDGQIPGGKDFIPSVKNPLVILSGMYIKFINYWTLKKKWRRYTFLLGVLLSFFLAILLYLMSFNYIEPSVQLYQNVHPDLQAWNRDGEIHSIEYNFIYIKTKPVFKKAHVDARGIIFRPVFSDRSKYIVAENIDTLYVPTDMSQAIINLYNAYQDTPDVSYLSTITTFTRWLQRNVIVRDSIAFWTHPYGFAKYDLKAGWTGAWAMGSILSALARCYQISADPAILALGKMAVKTFTRKIEDGGILAVDANGDYWYEEYPAIPKNSVLNGHINGILGLYDFWRVSEDSLAAELVRRGIKTVKENLYRYDSGYWSYYDLEYPYVTDYYYHTIVHIPQLKILFQLSADPFFQKYAEKWQAYIKEPYYSLFKLKILIDAIHRRLTYKSFFTWGKSSG